jgi:aquaporin Z
LVEFICTFFLALIIVLTVNNNAGKMALFAIGSILMVMFFVGGHVYGGHYNPAVSLGVWIRGKCTTAAIPGYIKGQLLGGLLGVITGKYLLGFIPGATKIITSGTFDFIGGALAEFLGTFALVWAVLNIATDDDTKGKSFYGFAIGFTIMACAYGLGEITRGAFNPAVDISSVSLISWSNTGTFFFGQLLAGVVASFVFIYVIVVSLKNTNTIIINRFPKHF